MLAEKILLVDFVIGLLIFVLNLPNGQVLFFWGNSNHRIVINPANSKWFLGYLQLALMAGCKTSFLCTLHVFSGLCIVSWVVLINKTSHLYASVWSQIKNMFHVRWKPGGVLSDVLSDLSTWSKWSSLILAFDCSE